MKTESDKRQLIELKNEYLSLNVLLIKKQILIDFQDKMIELAEEKL